MDTKRKRRFFMSDLIISCIVVAILFGIIGFMAGQRMVALNAPETVSQNTAEIPNVDALHYSCTTCGYSFNDLSTLRMEYRQSHYYYCPACGELLTSDVSGNALTSIKTVDYYIQRVTDNWE